MVEQRLEVLAGERGVRALLVSQQKEEKEKRREKEISVRH